MRFYASRFSLCGQGRLIGPLFSVYVECTVSGHISIAALSLSRVNVFSWWVITICLRPGQFWNWSFEFSLVIELNERVVDESLNRSSQNPVRFSFMTVIVIRHSTNAGCQAGILSRLDYGNSVPVHKSAFQPVFCAVCNRCWTREHGWSFN